MSSCPVAPTVLSECSTCEALSTAPSSTSPLTNPRTNLVCLPYPLADCPYTDHVAFPANLSPPPAGQSPTRTGSGSNSTLISAPPLLRIAASPHDAHLLATFSQESNLIRVLDVRQPGQALLELRGHGANVNTIEWSSTNRGVLASGADDCCVLLWDLAGGQATPSASGTERGPNAVWECGFEISNLSWAPTSGGLGVCGGKGFWGVQM